MLKSGSGDRGPLNETVCGVAGPLSPSGVRGPVSRALPSMPVLFTSRDPKTEPGHSTLEKSLAGPDSE